MRVTPIACLSDNYAYLLVCPETKEAAIVDVSEAGPVLAAIDRSSDRRNGARVTAILSTHHHPDHVGGNLTVREALGVDKVYGFASDKGRIPGQTEFLEDGQTFTIGTMLVRAIHVPGHTLGAVAYVVSREPHDPVLFTGDTLFIGGCGRIFEGDASMMHASLQKLATLAARTRVYCGHEYTDSNLRFATHVEPSNEAVRIMRAKVAALRKEGKPTVPQTIGEELGYNPFLRTQCAEIRTSLSIPLEAPAEEALGTIRRAKDGFR